MVRVGQTPPLHPHHHLVNSGGRPWRGDDDCCCPRCACAAAAAAGAGDGAAAAAVVAAALCAPSPLAVASWLHPSLNNAAEGRVCGVWGVVRCVPAFCMTAWLGPIVLCMQVGAAHCPSRYVDLFHHPHCNLPELKAMNAETPVMFWCCSVEQRLCSCKLVLQAGFCSICI